MPRGPEEEAFRGVRDEQAYPGLVADRIEKLLAPDEAVRKHGPRRPGGLDVRRVSEPGRETSSLQSRDRTRSWYGEGRGERPRSMALGMVMRGPLHMPVAATAAVTLGLTQIRTTPIRRPLPSRLFGVAHVLDDVDDRDPSCPAAGARTAISRSSRRGTGHRPETDPAAG